MGSVMGRVMLARTLAGWRRGHHSAYFEHGRSFSGDFRRWIVVQEALLFS